MNNLDQIDVLALLDNLEEADAEYFRIKISRCKNDAEAKKYRAQLALIEQALRIKYQERIKGSL